MTARYIALGWACYCEGVFANKYRYGVPHESVLRASIINDKKVMLDFVKALRNNGETKC